MSLKADAEKHYEEAQLTKMRAIYSYKLAGDKLIELRALLKPATKNNPLVTDMGVFTGWDHYLKETGWTKSNAHDYITLAENWDIVLSLGMQDTTSPETVKKCMRLCRTIKVIRWYKTKLEQGYKPEQLSLDLYWEEVEGKSRAAGPTKRELQAELDSLRVIVKSQEQEIALLKQQLASRRLAAV
jgi:hypothetical protein